MSGAIKLTLTAVEPLVITDGTTDGMRHQCLDYIPGNMILGALAWRWIKGNKSANPDDDATFRKLFLSPSVRYLHGYPLLGGKRTWPSPLTLQHVKNQSKLPGTELDPKKPPVIINALAFSGDNNSVEAQKAYASAELEKQEISLESLQLKKVSPAFLCPDSLIRAEIGKQWNMHVAIDPKLRRHKKEQLFGYQAISPGAKFDAAILYDDDDGKVAIEALLAGLTEIRVGHSRSAGYGRVGVKVETGAPFAEAKSMTASAEQVLRVMLLSDYIPRKSWAAPLDAIHTELEKALGALSVADNGNFATYREIQGFNGKWGLPRETRIALARGSVLSFKTTKAITEAAIKDLLRTGIGGFRNEGYGRICVNPEMLKEKHLTFGAVTATRNDNAATRQEGPQPESPSLRVLRKRALRRIADETAASFLSSKEVRDFLSEVGTAMCTKPSNSQLSRIRSMAQGDKKLEEWQTEFEGISSKTAAGQWKVAVKNFMKSDQYKPATDYLCEVMKHFLNPNTFNPHVKAVLSGNARELPGDALSDGELKTALERIHRLAVTGLMETIIVRRRANADKGGKK